ncbi:HutD family protein [Paraburkholderia sp. BL23I1N1]|uniref:HutD/Ves family protein n=1 Tax=Paraburkholderia sp. BL23I1N1 TaxID=1938802 RepID=UPI000E758546|nr:HutD family protein [Paraburkholderia sp. BL23I1N1]
MALHGSPVDNRATITLIRGADLVAAPWKNGGGVTREVGAFPAGAGLDAFTWRVSIADVAQAGPFSRFAGIDRTLVLLSGAGMLLDETDAGGAHSVQTLALTQPLDIAQFAGEAQIDARLVNGATRDFNLMVRRGAAVGETEVWRGATQRTLSADVVLLFCASGSVSVTLGGEGQPHVLQADDTLRIDTPSALSCTVEGADALLAISIRNT